MEKLNLITAISSLIAAILWLSSTMIRLNRKDGISQLNMAATIEKQSKYSAWAAIFATIAAIAQSIIFFKG